MEIKDVAGLGKVLPIDKLVDLISNSFGRMFKSYFDRRDIDTEAYKIEKIAGARAKEIKIMATAVKENFKQTGGIKYEEQKIVISSPVELLPVTTQPLLPVLTLEERTQERFHHQEAKKQLNIENVAASAAEELKDEQPVTDEPIDEDWTTRFFRIVEDVSNEEMQILWGKVLAGEIKQPGSYSLRTLELIRNLSKYEAETFMKVAKLAIKLNTGYLIFKGNSNDKLSNEFGVTYSDIALLVEVGLIQTGDFIEQQILQQAHDHTIALIAGKIVIIIKVKANIPTFGMPVYIFTKAGNELLNLNKPNPPFDYLKYLINSIKSESVTVNYAFITSVDGNTINHTMPLQEF